MLLEPQDAQLFFRLHRTLMHFVNQRLEVVPDIGTPEQFASLPPELRLKVREAFLDEIDLIEIFADQNPGNLADDELDIVLSWRHQVCGDFYILRGLNKYTVFLSSEKQPVAYGVLALTQPFEELVGPYLPVMTQTVLMPFKDKIIYDGLLSTYRISFGPGIRRSLNESFKEAKERHGIVTSLPFSDAPQLLKTTKAKPKARKQPSKDKTADALKIIVGLIDQFCRDHLNEEYAALCCELAKKLSRKRPSPLSSGKPNTWACAIVRTIGWVNFLDNRSQKPHMKLTAIDKAFGVGESTGQGKSMLIRRMFKIRTFDPTWTLPSRLEKNPLVWMLQVNGILMDIRHAPREAQEAAFEKGLIPYIPADRVALNQKS
jgi:hypothetical protein